MGESVLEPLFSRISALDWDDVAEVNAASAQLLEALDEDRKGLRTLLENAAVTPELVELSERLDHLDKIVLHDDPSGWRLRLHLFLLSCEDWPHSHRWTFTSRILEGSYRHNFYGSVVGVSPGDRLSLLASREERRGSCYTLHCDMIHTALGVPGTVSLLVRGPTARDRFLVTDAAAGTSWWRYGAVDEPADVVSRKRMDAEHLAMRAAELVERGVLP